MGQKKKNVLTKRKYIRNENKEKQNKTKLKCPCNFRPRQLLQFQLRERSSMVKLMQ